MFEVCRSRGAWIFQLGDHWSVPEPGTDQWSGQSVSAPPAFAPPETPGHLVESEVACAQRLRIDNGQVDRIARDLHDCVAILPLRNRDIFECRGCRQYLEIQDILPRGEGIICTECFDIPRSSASAPCRKPDRLSAPVAPRATAPPNNYARARTERPRTSDRDFPLPGRRRPPFPRPDEFRLRPRAPGPIRVNPAACDNGEQQRGIGGHAWVIGRPCSGFPAFAACGSP